MLRPASHATMQRRQALRGTTYRYALTRDLLPACIRLVSAATTRCRSARSAMTTRWTRPRHRPRWPRRATPPPAPSSRDAGGRRMRPSPPCSNGLRRAQAAARAASTSRRSTGRSGSTSGCVPQPLWQHVSPAGAAGGVWALRTLLALRSTGTSKPALAEKKPTGFSMKPAYSTGMTGKSSGLHTWVCPNECHTTMSVFSIGRFCAA